MKKTILFTALSLSASLLSNQTLAADIGLTATFGGSNEIRLPIKVKNFIFEPYLSHLKSTDDTYQSKDTYKQNSFGLGVWRVMDLSEGLEVQYGLQAAIAKVEASSSVKYDGYSVAPGLGLFYSFTPKFQIGTEVKFIYSNLDAKYVNTYNNGSITDTQTSSSIIARLYF